MIQNVKGTIKMIIIIVKRTQAVQKSISTLMTARVITNQAIL